MLTAVSPRSVTEAGKDDLPSKGRYDVDDPVLYFSVFNKTEKGVRGTVIAAFENGAIGYTYRLRLDGGEEVGNVTGGSLRLAL